MIDAKKVHLMTKIAIYEEETGKKEIKMYRHIRNTYVSKKRLETLVTLSIAYLLAAAIYCFRYITDIMTEGFAFNYRPVIIQVAVGYVLLCVFGYAFATRHYGKKYDIMKRHIKKYDADLGRLKKYMEESSKEEAGCEYDEIN